MILQKTHGKDLDDAIQTHYIDDALRRAQKGFSPGNLKMKCLFSYHFWKYESKYPKFSQKRKKKLLTHLLSRSKHDNPFYGYDENQDTTFEEELHIKEDVDTVDLDVQDNIVENLRTHFMEQIDADKQCDHIESRETSNDTGVEPSQRYSESYPYIKPIYQQMCSVAPNSEALDENDMFYLSMSRMTKRLPKLEQAKIKLLLSKSVLEAEIRLEETNT